MRKAKHNPDTKTVAPEEFVRAWQTSHSAISVAAMFGLSRQAVYSRAAQYRAKGIPLKTMQVGRKPVEVAALTALAKKLAPKS